MRLRRSLPLLWAAALVVGGCSGGGNAQAPIIQVTVTPIAVNLHVAKSRQFTAVVHGSSNQAVTWSVTGAGCAGTACGTIGAHGLYVAPSVVPDPTRISITATAAADTTKSATSTSEILPAVLVTVTPVSPNVHVGRKQQFSATVRNALDAHVTWTVTGSGCTGVACGTVDANGVYTAPETPPSPATITVTATSIEDTTKSDGSVVMVIPASAAMIRRSNAVAGP